MAQIPKTQYQVTVEPISTKPETTTLDRWFNPLSVPSVLSKPGLKTSEHPAFFWHISTAKETTTVDRWHQPLSLPTPAKAALNPASQQAHTEPVSEAKETTTLDRWFSPLSAPITPRQWPMAAAEQQAHTEPVSLAKETTSLDRWFAPLSVPVLRTPSVANQLPHAEPVSESRETTTLDRWHQPFSLPPRQAPFAAAQQQAHTEPVSESPETVTVDRWLVPLSQPVFARVLPVACAMDWQAWSTFTPPVVLAVTVASWFAPFSTPMPVLSRVAMMPPPTGPPNTSPETTTVDRWFAPLSLPVLPRQAPMPAAQQQAFTSPLSEAPETTSLDRWYQPLSVAPPARAALAAAQQQAFTEPLSEAPETTSLDRWFAPLSTPPPPRAALAAAQQQAFWWSGLTPPPPATTSVDRWYWPLELPVWTKPGLLAGSQQTLVEPLSEAPETTSLDRWFSPLSTPPYPRQLPFLAAQQLAFTSPLSEAPETTSLDRWFAPLSLPVLRIPSVASQLAFTEPASEAPETTSVDRWFAPLSVPSVLRFTIPAAQQQAFWWSGFTPPAVASIAWFVPLATPTPAKTALLPGQQQAHTEPVSLAKETVSIDRWLQPLSVPSVLSRAGLLPGSQQVLAEPLAEVPETTSLDRWFAPLSTPPAFLVRRRTAEFPAHTEPVSLAKETTTLDRWHQPLSVPVRRVPAMPAGEQRELFWSTFTPAVTPTAVNPGAGSITITGFPPTITVAPFPFHFGLTNAGIFMEAFDRLQIRPHDIDRHMMQSAVTSLNEALQDWTNETETMWSVVSGTINLVPGQVTYALPSNLVQLFDVTYVTIASSVLMVPMQRSHYAAIGNKLARGTPKHYWFQMLVQPQITIWQAPDQAQTLQWWGLQKLQDARIGSGETPNIPYRGFDALCANLAARLCEKVGKKWMQQEKTLFAKAAWEKLQRRDQEPGTTEIRLMTSKYRRMR